MKIKNIVLCILLICTIAVSFPLYRFYTQEDITKQEAYEIGKKVLLETTADESAIIDAYDSVDVWYVRAFCKDETQHAITDKYYVEISKRTGKIVTIGYEHKFTGERKYEK